MNPTLRNLVRDRAGGRCEYCRLPEAAVEINHVIDHVVARQHRGGDEPANLAFACVVCNRHKGTSLSGKDPETGQTVTLFNPRIDVWKQHFRWVGNHLVGITVKGRATVQTLNMNGDLQLIIRRATQDDWPTE
jgi:hypothetical protein